MNTINLLEKIKNFYLLFEDDSNKDNKLPPTGKPVPEQPQQQPKPQTQPQPQQPPLDKSIKDFFKGLLEDFASWKKENGNNEKSFKEFTNYLKKLDGVDISKIDKILN